MFPLVQLPKKFKEEICSEDRDVIEFPLVQLPKKFKGYTKYILWVSLGIAFPLVQLPKKFKDDHRDRFQRSR